MSRLFPTLRHPHSHPLDYKLVLDDSSWTRLFVERFERATDKLASLVRKLKSFHGPSPLMTSSEPVNFESFEAVVSKEEFLRKVDSCLEAIKAGEIFQIQIGNRLSKKTLARPFDIFRHLRMINPSPYMFFAKFQDHHLIGASPEMMIQIEGNQVVHRPIAGTRKRTWDEAQDKKAKEDLISSEKERAEHVMLVDLSRNDIGRVSLPGTVVVEELMKIEEYSHVFHLVSQVKGTLADGVSCFKALEFSFPNGTVTGAPKIKSMELINQFETVARDFYAGSLGYIGFNHDIKMTLLIRTIHYANKVATTQASAGIVYDSVPEHEWQETRNKMQACLLAIQNTHG